MRAIFTDHALDNKDTPEMKWLLNNKDAKDILDYFIDNTQEHFLVQSIFPNFTFTDEYVFDNKDERPAVYFEKNAIDRMKNIIKRTAKKDLNFADYNIANIKVDIENECREVKFFLRNGENLVDFFNFLLIARKANFLHNQIFMFFNRDIAKDIYFTISGGLEKKYLFATIADKFLFTSNQWLFINKCSFLTVDKKERIDIEMQKVRVIDEIF